MPYQITSKQSAQQIGVSQFMLGKYAEEDIRALFRIIDSMLTKSKFKDFFQKNVAALKQQVLKI